MNREDEEAEIASFANDPAMIEAGRMRVLPPVADPLEHGLTV